jgi:transposase
LRTAPNPAHFNWFWHDFDTAGEFKQIGMEMFYVAGMCLLPQTTFVAPKQTERVARAAFPKGSLCLRIADELGPIFLDEQFAGLFPRRGQPAEAPARLAFVTLLQYAENLSDRQAADAVRARIDWKYALGLELSDPGFDSTVLSEFRTRLVKGSAEHVLLDTLLRKCQAQKLLLTRGRQRTDSTHVLGAIRAMNRLEGSGETMRHALNVLAVVAPGWLREHSRTEWIDRYGPRLEDYRLPKTETLRLAHAQQIGMDGYWLLDHIYAHGAPAWLRPLPAVDILRRVWMQQYYRTETEVRWRSVEDGFPPAGLFISSPYDPEAHYAKKRTTSWVGYKVHLTESCEEGTPHLITHVETTSAPMADGEVTTRIHAALAQKSLLPSTHLVDTGYVDATVLAASQRDYGVELLGPTRTDNHWQANEQAGFAASNFQIDWEKQQAICPQERKSVSWTPAKDGQREVIKIKFASVDCGACASRNKCTRATQPRRTLTIRPQEEYLALHAARLREAKEGFAKQYALRAGIEGTISQGVRAFGLRRARYFGTPKTHLQHVLIAAAINLVRLAAWFAGALPSSTRTPPFVAILQSGST